MNSEYSFLHRTFSFRDQWGPVFKLIYCLLRLCKHLFVYSMVTGLLEALKCVKNTTAILQVLLDVVSLLLLCKWELCDRLQRCITQSSSIQSLESKSVLAATFIHHAGSTESLWMKGIHRIIVCRCQNTSTSPEGYKDSNYPFCF